MSILAALLYIFAFVLLSLALVLILPLFLLFVVLNILFLSPSYISRSLYYSSFLPFAHSRSDEFLISFSLLFPPRLCLQWFSRISPSLYLLIIFSLCPSFSLSHCDSSVSPSITLSALISFSPLLLPPFRNSLYLFLCLPLSLSAFFSRLLLFPLFFSVSFCPTPALILFLFHSVLLSLHAYTLLYFFFPVAVSFTFFFIRFLHISFSYSSAGSYSTPHSPPSSSIFLISFSFSCYRFFSHSSSSSSPFIHYGPV